MEDNTPTTSDPIPMDLEYTDTSSVSDTNTTDTQSTELSTNIPEEDIDHQENPDDTYTSDKSDSTDSVDSSDDTENSDMSIKSKLRCINQNVFTLSDFDETDDPIQIFILDKSKTFKKSLCMTMDEFDGIIESGKISPSDADASSSVFMTIYTTPNDYNNTGYGGKPTGQIVVKTPLNNMYITYNSAFKIKKYPNVRKWFALPLFNHKRRRVGNLHGFFGVSMNHGQTPGFIIYALYSQLELKELTDLNKENKIISHIQKNISLEDDSIYNTLDGNIYVDRNTFNDLLYKVKNEYLQPSKISEVHFPPQFYPNQKNSIYTLLNDTPINTFINNMIKRLLNKNSEDIYQAIEDENYNYIADYIESGKSLDIEHDEYSTPLIFAIKKKSLFIQYLIDKGADINKGDGITYPILESIATFNFKIFKYLLSKGAFIPDKFIFDFIKYTKNDSLFVNVTTLFKRQNITLPINYIHKDTTSLIYSIQNNLTNTSLYILNHIDTNLIYHQDDDGYNLLMLSNNLTLLNRYMYICENNYMDKHLNDQDERGETALMHSIYRNDIDKFTLLLENNADVSILDENHENILFKFQEDIDLEPFLETIDQFFDELQFENILDVQNADGQTPLLYHQYLHNNHRHTDLNNHENICLYLLTKHANPFILNRDGNSFFLLNTTYEILDYIVKKYPEQINHQSSSKNTLLSISASAKVYSFIEFLLEKGADANIPNNDGNLALHLFCDDHDSDTNNSKFFEILRKLIEKTSDINHQNNIGDTVLIVASKDNNITLVNYLIKYTNINKNLTNSEGMKFDDYISH